jgi:iron-sulfur cluster assembly protein
VRVFIDPKSYIYLDGSTLEYQTTMMGRGFKFTNPNVKGTCGCGESVQF